MKGVRGREVESEREREAAESLLNEATVKLGLQSSIPETKQVSKRVQ